MVIVANKTAIHEQNEAFEEKDRNIAFHHTIFIPRDATQYFYTTTK